VPALFFLIPLIGVIILNLPFRKLMKKTAFWFAAALFIVHIALVSFHHMGSWGTGLLQGSFFNVNFYVDQLTFIMLLSISIVSLASLLVARALISDENKRFNFINLLITAAIGMNGIVMVRDIFSLYVFLEVAAVSAFIMITINKDKPALEGAFKYILLSAIATIMMLSSIGLLLLVSGDTSFSAISAAIASSPQSMLVKLAIAIFLCGLFIKGGLIPFHGWLPDAYSAAAAPASVLLAGIVTKVSGIYTLIRIVTSLFGFTPAVSKTLLLIGAASIVIGAFAALGQKDLKRMLAYSSISQVGYIIIGFGTGSVLGVAGAVFHLFNHAIFKSLLFVNAAALEKETGTVDMDKLGGLSRTMPVTGTTSAIAFLSTSGIPPLAGFWSKVIIIIALWQAGYIAYAVVAVLTSILTAAYLITMQRKVFFGNIAPGLEGTKEAPAAICIASIILAAITVGVGVFFPMVFNNFILPVKDILIK
jgi:multicomponent Na+:H+ antiporter subunit D